VSAGPHRLPFAAAHSPSPGRAVPHHTRVLLRRRSHKNGLVRWAKRSGKGRTRL